MSIEVARRRHGPHKDRRNRLGQGHRRWLYLCSFLLFASGAGWLIAHYALRGEGLLSEAPHPSEVWWMRLHGAALLGFLVCFGALLPRHIGEGWRHRLNRGSGLTVIIIVGTLTITGYGLYYAGGDALRRSMSVLHWSVGLVSLVALLFHIVQGRRARADGRGRRSSERSSRK